ncbi:hypothetical protein BATDEDRAFT_92659 [Batrachochytrium dendrobatidis JAM81]|uniref:Large ribosomal subunit protein mL54 n=1 Tax=Batrachochytrium dendrobatidis (strain JAM81 / FGSC 10211) TaxID=684364 RepID=F4PE30_BATDJ|nr:mitochondrial 54S ribosomal protein YmL37 [Batrachochytrium dendrobatidis JAM81]EGF76481.1 hypothetical protein BATDEDRAFT_92659 [Batrachochytrium dendrobatidis JAM81]|eukprot:XP_006682884.1 hypothetical protein BATDEDRAFT_92659 [Batrachochytrium dendrobatidis JAM81]
MFLATAIISSCKKGTVLKGINVLKDGQDPVAMDDSEYPAWLWKLLDPKPDYLALEDKLDINYLRTITRAKIRANTLAKQTKSF